MELFICHQMFKINGITSYIAKGCNRSHYVDNEVRKVLLNISFPELFSRFLYHLKSYYNPHIFLMNAFESDLFNVFYFDWFEFFFFFNVTSRTDCSCPRVTLNMYSCFYRLVKPIKDNMIFRQISSKTFN